VNDFNEISGDITPYVRTIDAINPSDEMFLRISSGGVTTSLILPGFVFSEELLLMRTEAQITLEEKHMH
jgi:hypothetical protein